MKVYEHAFNVLNKVVFESIPFHVAVKSSLKKEKKKIIDPSFRSGIYSLSGCVLRHYYIFERIVKKEYEGIEDNNALLMSLLLANNLFTKTCENDELLKYIKHECELDGGLLLEKYSDSSKLIPEEVKPETDEFYHLRYNLPLWLVRMWRKNCGPILSKRLYRGLSSKDLNSLRIDNNKISDTDFINKYSDFKLLESGGIAYNRQIKNIKQCEPVKNGDALLCHGGYKYLLDQVDVDFLRGVAIYGGCSNDLLKEMYASRGTNLKLEYLCGNQKHFFEVREDIKDLGLMDLHVYECAYNAIETCISKPVHAFFLFPENSFFQGLVDNPDYFLRIKQEDLDAYIQIQKALLNESAPHVEEDGYLIYALPTVCKNETKRVIHNFLSEHSEFSLVEEKQLFPFDKYQTMLYFSILRKEAEHD